jgi:pyruvate/2-oxoglutarate/acetoin dehydrogenase E1 component
MKIVTVGPVDPAKLKETVAVVRKDPIINLKGIYEKRSLNVLLSESTFYLLNDKYLLAAALEENKPILLFSHKVLFKTDIENSDAKSFAPKVPDSTFPISIRRIINMIEWSGTQYDARLFRFTLKKIKY